MQYVVKASTPEQLRDAYIAWLQNRQANALAHANVKNQSNTTRQLWYRRHQDVSDQIAFLQALKIEPLKETPDAPSL